MEMKKSASEPIMVYDMYGNPYVVRPSRLDALPFVAKACIVIAVFAAVIYLTPRLLDWIYRFL
jgi:hypothetical protein